MTESQIGASRTAGGTAGTSEIIRYLIKSRKTRTVTKIIVPEKIRRGTSEAEGYI